MKNKIHLTLILLALTLGATIAIVSVVVGEPSANTANQLDPAAHDVVTASELSDWIIEGKRDFVVVDMRSAEDYKRGHVKGAVHCGSCHTNAAEGNEFMTKNQSLDLSKKLVVYSNTSTDKIMVPRILTKNHNLATLAGGYAQWDTDVMGEVIFSADDSEEASFEKRRKQAVRDYLMGKNPSAVPPKLSVKGVRRPKKHKAAVAEEGC